MDTFVQQLINGLTIGAIYALIALGYTMVYGILRLINFAHGDIYMVGAFVGYFLAFQLGWTASLCDSAWYWSLHDWAAWWAWHRALCYASAKIRTCRPDCGDGVRTDENLFVAKFRAAHGPSAMPQRTELHAILQRCHLQTQFLSLQFP